MVFDNAALRSVESLPPGNSYFTDTTKAKLTAASVGQTVCAAKVHKSETCPFTRKSLDMHFTMANDLQHMSCSILGQSKFIYSGVVWESPLKDDVI